MYAFRNCILSCTILSCTALLAIAAPAFAQETVGASRADEGRDVVIVTANKREENIQEVPIAVTAIGGQVLQDLGVTDIRNLNALAPSLQIKTDDNAANPKLFIRGIGLNDFNPNTASAVAIYTDGVYIGSPLAQMGQFFDLDRVEVLRGPQGTLYGRNTTGGAINVISRKPSDSSKLTPMSNTARTIASRRKPASAGPSRRACSTIASPAPTSRMTATRSIA